MQDLGRITSKIKLGGGLNLLCYSLAGYIAIKTIDEMDKIVNRSKRDRELAEAVEVVKAINNFTDQLRKNIKEPDEEKV